MTEVVKENNSFSRMMDQLAQEQKGARRVAVPQFTGQESHFNHVVYIIKENRTYDQVFGDLTQGNGEPSLVHFGREVTPNHHALAEEFVLMDNYYCSGILSADGHQWTDEAYVTDYIEKFFGDFPRSYPYDGDDPLAYASSGFIWDNVLKHGLSYRNYGEFVDAVIEPENATFTDIYQDFLAVPTTSRSGQNQICHRWNPIPVLHLSVSRIKFRMYTGRLNLSKNLRNLKRMTTSQISLLCFYPMIIPREQGPVCPPPGLLLQTMIWRWDRSWRQFHTANSGRRHVFSLPRMIPRPDLIMWTGTGPLVW